jgi:methylmalonyl-CoA/ethylmalonyl-CoA epimerase
MEDAMTTQTKEIETAVHFDKIGQIAISVTDLARSKDFYQNTLGMKFLFDAGSMAFFPCGEIRFMIGVQEEPFTPGGTIVYFKVGDIQRTYALLLEQEVVFTHAPHLVARMPDHDLWMAFFNDPDGNLLGMMSEVPRA